MVRPKIIASSTMTGSLQFVKVHQKNLDEFKIAFVQTALRNFERICRWANSTASKKD